MFPLAVVEQAASASGSPWVSVRASRHAVSGWVAVALFPSFALASQFSRWCGLFLPAACHGAVVRPVGQSFGVSVPVVCCG